MEKFKHICEVCGKEEILTSEEAYAEGWDYPPFMGTFGIVSPRTCPDCSMKETAWFALTCKKKPLAELSEKQRAAVNRILTEPEELADVIAEMQKGGRKE